MVMILGHLSTRHLLLMSNTEGECRIVEVLPYSKVQLFEVTQHIWLCVCDIHTDQIITPHSCSDDMSGQCYIWSDMALHGCKKA